MVLYSSFEGPFQTNDCQALSNKITIPTGYLQSLIQSTNSASNLLLTFKLFLSEEQNNKDMKKKSSSLKYFENYKSQTFPVCSPFLFFCYHSYICTHTYTFAKCAGMLIHTYFGEEQPIIKLCEQYIMYSCSP